MTDETITDPTLDAPAVDAAAAPADPVADPAAVDAAPAAQAPADAAQLADVDPTLEEAEAMFADRPDLDAVRTTEGWLHRDGVLTVLTPALSGE